MLIVGNECISSVSSNGRTLRNFLIGWPKNQLAQFYIHGSSPAFEVCQNYYRVSDHQALNAFLHKKNVGGVVSCCEDRKTASEPKASKPKRNALTMLARELIWSSKCWMTPAFKEWCDNFAPELILLQAGDCAFMFQIAAELARKYRIQLVIYNSEGYYLKKFDYFRAKGIAHLCYPIFYKYFCRVFEKTIKQAALSIYICDPLKNDYDLALSLPSATVYTATEMKVKSMQKDGETFTVSYLGNLGVGRHEPLIEIAEVLQNISKEYYLDVYGKIPNNEVSTAFEVCPGIRYKGFVSYEQVIQIMQDSDLLIHAENFNEFYREDLKYAFSTKIADSLASGTCFLVYAPEEMACSRYLSEHKAAYIACNRGELHVTLRSLSENPEMRNKYLSNAALLVEKNHNAERNAKQFQEYLRQAVKD